MGVRIGRLGTVTAAAVACLFLCLVAVGPGPAEARGHKSRLISKPPLGLHFPRIIGEMRMIVLHEVGDPDIALYSPAAPPQGPQRILSIAVGQRSTIPTLETMRDRSRAHAAGGGPSDIIAEGPFSWPGHEQALTFHGSYTGRGLRLQYWHAWQDGYGVMVIAETPLDEPERMARLAAAVVATIFAGEPAG